MRHYLSREVSSRLINTALFTLVGFTLAALTLFMPVSAWAHDTWLIPKPAVNPAPAGAENGVLLLPGTGDFFPRPDFLTPRDRIETIHCEQANRTIAHSVGSNARLGFQIALNPKISSDNSAQPNTDPTFCTIKLEREYIELDLEKVPPYLDDIAASPKVRRAWARMQSKGMIWKENYTKIARVEVGAKLSNRLSRAVENDGEGSVQGGLASNPFSSHAEILSAQPNQQPKQGKFADFVLLHRGKPLAGQPVQWISSENGQRGWLRTNKKGMVSVPIDALGNWMLRGTVIRLATDDTFESDFFTLVFAVKQ